MLEALQHPHNAFVTLTYDDEHLPRLKAEFETSSDFATLVPTHLQNFLKRLRKAIAPLRIRFYAVGEYGDASFRPHYHAALFNFPTCFRGRTRRVVGQGERAIWRGCCPQCELVGENWGHGDVDLGMLETSSAQYVAGYCTKKMTRRDDARLLGREPEFSRMSNRPGIAHDALWEFSSQWLHFNLDQTQGDVPVTLRHGSRELPLGRYLRRRLRQLTGKDQKTPEAQIEAYQETMRQVREIAFDTSRPFKQVLLETSKGELANFHSKIRIRGNRRDKI